MTPLEIKRTAYQNLLDAKLSRLKFPSKIENHFQSSLFHHLKFRYNLLANITIVMLIVYAIADWLALPANVHEFLIPTRISILIPVICFAILVAQSVDRPKYFNVYLGGLYLSFGLSTIYMIYFAHQVGFPLPYEGLYICIMYGYLLLSMPFLLTLLLSSIIFIVYALMLLLVIKDHQALLFNGGFLLSANIIAAVGCYIHEYQVRRSFLSERVLSMSNEIAAIDSQRQMRFLATASHDLRQPLHALSLFTESLKQQIEQPEHQKTLHNIDLSTQSLSSQLNSLLDISRLSLGQEAINTCSIKLRPLLNKIHSEYNTIAEKNGINLRFYCRDAHTVSDPLLLDRIIRNLLDNAFKHAHASKILVAVRYTKNGWKLEVRDNGIGIIDENQSKIFDAFEQINNPNRLKQKGLGLGLASVQYLSQSLKHPLALTSEINKGSMFSLLLPKSDPIPEEITSLKAPKSTNYTMLLVDNDLAVLNSMTELAQHWGYKVLTSSTVEEALTKFKNNKIDILLTDYRLDDNNMNGLELGIHIHETLDSNLPIIMITGDTQPELEEATEEEGMLILHKPIKSSTLITLLNTLLP
jgi:signal transduction histidine kinase/CheY-like chemotaxis protein